MKLDSFPSMKRAFLVLLIHSFIRQINLVPGQCTVGCKMTYVLCVSSEQMLCLVLYWESKPSLPLCKCLLLDTFFFFTQLCKIEKCYLYKYSFIKKKTTSKMSFLSFFGEFCPFMMHFQTISLCQESFLTSCISELEQ